MGETEPKKHFMGVVRAVPSPPRYLQVSQSQGSNPGNPLAWIFLSFLYATE